MNKSAIQSLILTEGEYRDKIIETMNKEALRNSNPEGHTYSEYCSCGRCHIASLLAHSIAECQREKLNK
jgi:hypothetical protein